MPACTSQAGARLHRVCDDAGEIDREPDDPRSVIESRSRPRFITRLVIEHDVFRHPVVHAWRARRDRQLRAHHRRKIAVLHDDELRSVLRRGRGLGDHDCDRVACKAHALLCKRGTSRIDELHAAAPFGGQGSRERLQPAGGDVPASEDAQHAGRAQRCARVDGENFRMRPVRAQKVRMGFARQVPVGHIASPAGKHALVLEPPFEHAAILEIKRPA
jgi:hypothetical protein